MRNYGDIFDALHLITKVIGCLILLWVSFFSFRIFF